MGCIAIQFADDTTLFIKADSNEELERLAVIEIKKVHTWLTANGLSMNESKTRVMFFDKNNTNIDLTINNVPIIKCGKNCVEQSINMLGIEVDQDLSWKYHMQKISTKITKGVFALYKFKHILNPRSKKLLYGAFVESHLRYGIELWGKSRGNDYNKLQKNVKKCLRSIEIGKFHTEPILKNNKLMKLADLYSNEMDKQAWIFFNDKLPTGIDSKLICRNIAHELRHTTSLILPHIRNYKDKYQFDYQLASHINNLNNVLKNERNKKTLKNRMKKNCLINYKDDVTCNLQRCYECVINMI